MLQNPALVMLQRIVRILQIPRQRSDTKTPGKPGVFRVPRWPVDRPATGPQGFSAAAGTTPFGEWLSARMICASRSRYGVPSSCNRSWNQIVGGCSV